MFGKRVGSSMVPSVGTAVGYAVKFTKKNELVENRSDRFETIERSIWF